MRQLLNSLSTSLKSFYLSLSSEHWLNYSIVWWSLTRNYTKNWVVFGRKWKFKSRGAFTLAQRSRANLSQQHRRTSARSCYKSIFPLASTGHFAKNFRRRWSSSRFVAGWTTFWCNYWLRFFNILEKRIKWIRVKNISLSKKVSSQVWWLNTITKWRSNLSLENFNDFLWKSILYFCKVDQSHLSTGKKVPRVACIQKCIKVFATTRLLEFPIYCSRIRAKRWVMQFILSFVFVNDEYPKSVQNIPSNFFKVLRENFSNFST